MLEAWKSGRVRFDIGMLSPGTFDMIKALFFLVLVCGPQQVAAASAPENQPAGDRTRLAQICKVDIQRFCDQANLKQECLVAHWDKISADCRAVLGTSAGNRSGSNSRD